MKSVISSYVKLTKPTIVLLFVLTGASAMVVEGSFNHSPLVFTMILLGITLTASSANALNMYFDRDIDEIMTRTRQKRPLPQKKVEPHQALIFGIVLAVLATAILLKFGHPMAAFLGVFTIVFYAGFYTLYLKRRTPYNIVIGGAAGATAPLIGWAAAHGELPLIPWLLFLIIFMWTPPHFWSLSLVVKEDYEKAGVPMLPVAYGEKRTRLEILIYSILLIPITLAPPLLKVGGIVYTVGGLLLGSYFLFKAYKLVKLKTKPSAYSLFGYSIFYLLVLFVLFMGGTMACSSKPAKPGFDAKFNELQASQSPDQVKSLLGAPDLKELKEQIETWHYNFEDGRYVQFTNNKVTGFGRSLNLKPKSDGDSKTPTILVPQPIGASCNENTDCQSQNCHFKRCAGKNNCSVPEGKICAQDSDCCTGFCDFSTCRKRK